MTPSVVAPSDQFFDGFSFYIIFYSIFIYLLCPAPLSILVRDTIQIFYCDCDCDLVHTKMAVYSFVNFASFDLCTSTFYDLAILLVKL